VEGWLEVDVERDDSPDCGDCWPMHEVQPAGVRENETGGERKRNGERIDRSFKNFSWKGNPQSTLHLNDIVNHGTISGIPRLYILLVPACTVPITF
jgi:hypothetical protein